MTTIRGLARLGASAAAHHSGLLEVYHRARVRDRGVVLVYHRVLEDRHRAAGVAPGMYVTRRTFELQLQQLRKAHTLVTIDQLGEWMSGRSSFERAPCAITFDDGWADNYDTAFPLLRQYGATATVFLITGSVGRPGMLQWSQVHEMERQGIAFGSHTVTHAELGRCAPSQIHSELAESRATLEAQLENPSRWFCFPRGSHSDTACAIVREYYTGAVTTLRGWVSREDDPCRLPRIGIHDDVARTRALFSWRLALLR